jgi:hypothetical protein
LIAQVDPSRATSSTRTIQPFFIERESTAQPASLTNLSGFVSDAG